MNYNYLSKYRLRCLIAAFAVSYALLPAQAFRDGDFEFDLAADSQAIVTGWYGSGVANIPVSALNPETNLTHKVAYIGQRAFANNRGLTQVYIPQNVNGIEESAFLSCHNLKTLSISTSLKSISFDAFSDCISLTQVEIPSSVQSIEHGAFSGCISLQTVTFRDGVSRIGTAAFFNCLSLRNPDLPSSVNHVGNFAFYACPALEEVGCRATTPPNVDEFSFTHSSTLHVSPDCVDVYKSSGWNDLFDNITGGFSGVETVVSESALIIRVENGDIIIENADSPVRIYSITGLLVYDGLDGRVSVPSSIYIVTSKNKTQKVKI